MKDRAFVISTQLKNPLGFKGRVTARRMEQNNSGLYHRFAELVRFTREDVVLELGYGPGYGVEYIASTFGCRVDGIDHSELMHRQATNRNRKSIADGLVTLQCSDVLAELPVSPVYTKVIAANMLYFWEDPQTLLEPAANVLVADGRMLIFMGSRESLMRHPAISTEVLHLHEIDRIQDLLGDLGFASVDVHQETLADVEGYYVIAGERSHST